MSSTNLSNEGTLVWFSEVVQSTSTNDINNDFSNLTSCSIITGTDGISLEVVKTGRTVAHFVIAQIVAWNIDKNDFAISFDCADQIDYIFYFISLSETLSADDRINQIVNGANLSGC